jgi:hypothetical protein
MKKLFTLLLLLPFLLRAQTITTIAGGALGPSSGDGGPATAAKIPGPTCGSFDKYGNYYFGESAINPRIRKIDVHGIISTVAGTGTYGFSGDGGPATAANLSSPFSLVDLDGNIYISDVYNYRIRKVDAISGIITTIGGSGSSGHSGDGGPATAASIYPWGLCVDPLGNIYVKDSTTWIRKISPGGTISAVAGTGFAGFSGDGGPATAAQISHLPGIWTNIYGDVYTGCGDGRIRKIDAVTGIINTIAGNGTETPFNGDGIPATAAQFNPIYI